MNNLRANGTSQGLNILVLRHVIILFLLIPQYSYSQLLNPTSREMNRRAEQVIIQSNPGYFTIIKPFVLYDFLKYDSYKYPEKNINASWLKRKLFYDSLVEVDSSEFYLFFNPAFDLSLGQDNTGRKTFTNTRGFDIGGRIGNNFAFGTSFYENQAIFPVWIQNSIQNKIISGQGRGRLNNQTWDYAHSSGYISFSPIKKLNIQLGQGKNFVGDGYRSLMLSDVAYNYPYSRITFCSEKLMYSWMLGVIQDISIDKGNDQFTYGKRMISSHVLATNITPALQVSIIKNTVYNNPDTMGKFDPGFEEFNPLIIPVKSSKSKSLWGLNLKWMIKDKLGFYGQAVFDNLTGNERLSKGFQVGSKYFNAFGLKGLYLQTEYNTIDPQTYNSENKTLLWQHFGESLAHPYGNNLNEGIVIAEFNYGRWQIQTFSRITRLFSKGNTSLRDIHHFNFQMNWFLNLKSTAHFSLGYLIHDEKTQGLETHRGLFYFAFRTALFNNYLFQ